MPSIKRRQFLSNQLKSLSAIPFLSTAFANQSTRVFKTPTFFSENSKAPKKTYKAAAIGSTGNGNFGHGLDIVFKNLAGVEFVALADDNPDGLKKVGERNGISRLYKDYRDMLKKEDIDIVSIAMRHSIFHKKIVVDCANAGKHIFCEKPIAPDLASADRMLKACEKNNVKITVSVQNRLSPAIHIAREIIESGQIGKLISMRGRGKEDSRGGGEDLMVLGFHIMDLMRFFGGDPQWVFADILQDGRPMVKSDAHMGREPNGPIAGDQIEAMYGFGNGVKGYFETHRNLKNPKERFNLNIYCSEGMITLRSLKDVMLLETPVFNPAVPHQWKPVTTQNWDSIEDKMHWGNEQIVLDLLHAVEENRNPLPSGYDGRWALEMILGTYVSHFEKSRVPLPLKDRSHPLKG
jgi:predicted dehydrogenase